MVDRKYSNRRRPAWRTNILVSFGRSEPVELRRYRDGASSDNPIYRELITERLQKADVKTMTEEEWLALARGG